MFVVNFTKSEIKALQARLPRELNSEELWAAYGPWIHTLAMRVIRNYPIHPVEVEELWGVGFQQMQSAARLFDRGKGTFTNYFTRLVKSKMHAYIWKHHSYFRPRPAHYETNDPSKGSLLWTQAQFMEAHHQDDSGGGAARTLGKIELAAKEVRRGNYNLYDMSPEEAVDVCQQMEAVQDLFLDTHGLGPKFINRVRRVMEDGEEARVVARDEGVDDNAVGYHVRDCRRLLKGESLEKVRADRNRKKNIRKAA